MWEVRCEEVRVVAGVYLVWGVRRYVRVYVGGGWGVL